MYCTRKVNDDYTWVGADCRRLALFEGVFGVPDGISFNSYQDGKGESLWIFLRNAMSRRWRAN